MKRIAALIIATVVAFSLTACEGGGGSGDNDLHGVIYMPMGGNPVGVPIFF